MARPGHLRTQAYCSIFSQACDHGFLFSSMFGSSYHSDAGVSIRVTRQVSATSACGSEVQYQWMSRSSTRRRTRTANSVQAAGRVNEPRYREGLQKTPRVYVYLRFRLFVDRMIFNCFCRFAERFCYVEELLQPSFTDAETSGFHVTLLQSNMYCDGYIHKEFYAMSRCTIDLASSEGLDGMKVNNPAQRAWTA